jgi:hypothetical protein
MGLTFRAQMKARPNPGAGFSIKRPLSIRGLAREEMIETSNYSKKTLSLTRDLICLSVTFGLAINRH